MRLIITIVLIALLSCNKESEYDKLPPITTTGEDVFSCLIDGKYWTYVIPLLYSGHSCSLSKNGISISAGDNDIRISLAIKSDSININTPISFELNNDSTQIGKYSLFRTYEPVFLTNEQKGFVGQIKFLRIDTVNRIISGTFWFDAINALGNTIEIREGRFDFDNLNYFPEYH